MHCLGLRFKFLGFFLNISNYMYIWFIDCNIDIINTTCRYIIKCFSRIYLFLILLGIVFIGNTMEVNSQVHCIYLFLCIIYVQEHVSLIWLWHYFLYQTSWQLVTHVYPICSALELNLLVYVIIVSVNVSQDTYWMAPSVTQVIKILIWYQ